MRRPLLTVILILAVLGVVAWLTRPALTRYFLKPTENPTAQPGLNGDQLASTAESGEQIEIVAENLRIPWEIVFLADGSLLVTERPGTLVRIWPDNRQSVPIQGVAHVGEGGLLGMVLHPDFADNHWLYLYSTTRAGDGLSNRVERYVFDEAANLLSDRTVILADIPGSSNHDGGRLAFGPDQLLYITTGDAEVQNNAQDTSSLAGKILRLTDEGGLPADNPFGNAVYSYGHRNPQGLAWDKQGRLWASEHGPSGSQTGNDEVNLIVKGGNYGWPEIKGTQTRAGLISPVIESGTVETWAPADALIVDDLVFFTGLRGEALYSARMTGSGLTDFKANFAGEYGRLRAVVLSPDGQWLYFTTSNTDGRGSANEGDDKIIRVKRELFE